ncbi:MAG: two-component regulator propeller domain-containing protein [Prevotellaceae bacterium]|nr:two-component regulator propeller domain-containing protein [Prevotellaceae bacterium]
MKKFHLIFLFLTFMVCASANTNNVQTNHLTIYDGLAGESVNAIFNDGSNVLWFGTTNGVTVFNGKRMRTINISPVRSKNVVRHITQSADGRMWLSTSSGVYYVDWLKSSSAKKVIPELDGAVNDILVIGNRLFISTNDGMFVYDMEKDKSRHIWINADHMSKTNSVCESKTDNKGRVWILSSNDLSLYDVKKGTLKSMNITKKIKIFNVLRTMDIVGNRIFIGTYNDGLFVFNMQDESISQYVDVGCRIITTISHDKENLYVGTDGAGVSVINLTTDETIKHYSTNDDSEIRLVDNSIYSFLHLENGVNIFGFYRHGVEYNYFVNPLFQTYQFGYFSTENLNVRSFCIDGARKVIGTRNGLYFIDEENNVVKNFSSTQFGGGIVTNIVKYNGKYYFSTFNNGVSQLDPDKLELSRFGTNKALQTMSFGSLAVSPNNELWMSSNNGVYVYNSTAGSERVFNKNNCPLLNSYVKSLGFDSKNRCWMGTELGLCIYNPIDDIISTNFPVGFFNKHPELIFRQGSQNKIIAYGMDGLFCTNEDMTEFSHIDTKETIGNDYISMVAYDKNHNNYWMGTERGLFCFNESFTCCSKYSEESGMNSRQFSSDAMAITNGSTLWVGTMEGLFFADLDKIAGNTHQKYDIMLDDININGVRLSDEEIALTFSRRKMYVDFNWSISTLSLDPVILNLAKQDNICYEYQIDDGKWHIMSQDASTTSGEGRGELIQGLHLGSNELHIRVAGKTDFTSYTVVVAPSTLFWLEIIAIIMIAFIIYFAWNRQKKLKYVREELEMVKSKYSRVRIGDDESEILYKKLTDYMIEEKPYTNVGLKLSDIAVYLNCSTVKLSQLLNVYANLNYYDFINKYRLAEFKQCVKSPAYSSYTLLALAEMCGFKKSSFFTTFKKMEGMTPSEYIKKVRK